MPRNVDRRWVVQRLALTGGVLGLVSPAAAQSGTPGATDATPAGQEWSFTDYLGRVVSAPERPARIAAEIGGAAALFDMGVQVASVWGAPANDPDGYKEAWGRLPVDSVENIANSDGEIDPEKAIVAGVDLFVLGSTELSDPDSYGGHDDYIDVIAQITPVAAWPFLARLDETTDAIWNLAIALGADPQSPENVAAQEAMDAAVSELQTVLAEKPGMTAFFGYPTPTELYVANYAKWDDVNYFQHLGLNVVPIDESLEQDWWEILSWEQALKYETDTVFLADVAGSLPVDELKEHATFSLHPAMQANQNGVWSWYFARSPQGITTLVQAVLDVVQSAEIVTERS